MKTISKISLNRSAIIFAFVMVIACAIGMPMDSYAEETITKTVDVDPGESKEKNVGTGFGDLSDDVYELKIELTSQREILDSGIDEQAGNGVIWSQDGDVTKYKIGGVTPNERFWVVIWAELKPDGSGSNGGNGSGGEGGKLVRWMSVSDLDADADTDNDSSANPRVPSESDYEDYAEYPGYQAPSTVPGLVIGVNDDHDEFLSDSEEWGRDMTNTTANLDKEGTHYDGQSVGLAQIKVKVGVKRAPGTLSFSVPSSVRLFEGEQPTSGNKGKEFIGDRQITTAGEHVYIFYLEGISNVSAPDQLVVTYTPEDGDGEAVDTITVLPMRMDIDVDSNNDGTIDEDDDLIEAKPTLPGMAISIPDNLDDSSEGKLGILRGFYSQSITSLLDDSELSPVVRLKRLPGSVGHVRVWKKLSDGEPVLMLDTMDEENYPGSATDNDGEENSLFDLLGEASDQEILITGMSGGKVLLGLEIMLNDTRIAMDVVQVYSPNVQVTIEPLVADSENYDHIANEYVEILAGGIDKNMCKAKVVIKFEPALPAFVNINLTLTDGGEGYQPKEANSTWWPKNRVRAELVTAGHPAYKAGESVNPITVNTNTNIEAILKSSNLLETVNVVVDIPSLNYNKSFPVRFVQGEFIINVGSDAMPVQQWHPVSITRQWNGQAITGHKSIVVITGVEFKDGSSVSAHKEDGSFDFLKQYVWIGENGNHNDRKYHELTTDGDGVINTQINVRNSNVLNVQFAVSDLEMAEALD